MIPDFTAGETINYIQSFEGYDPLKDLLAFDCVTEGFKFSIDATDNGDGGYLVNVSYTTTEEFKPGVYSYQAHITTGGGVRAYVESGTFEVKRQFSKSQSGYDDRSHVKKTLDALEATIEGKASQDQMSYSIAGRSLSRLSPTELLEWRERYKAEYLREVQAERLAQGLGNSRIIRVRM